MNLLSFLQLKQFNYFAPRCLVCCLLATQPLAGFSQDLNNHASTVTVTVDISQPVNQFVPSHALGAGVDGHAFAETERQLSPANIQRMLSAGFKPLTYRLRTELAGEAWHWNPNGTWSDAVNHHGYWTSDSKLGEPIKLSYGYRLPRRGNTIDQANDDGYSRIDDGDTKTFWKSNPYLDRHFTGEKNSLHPQWVMIDLGAWKRIAAIRIAWAEPFATKFAVQFGHFLGPEDLTQRLPTAWSPFPKGDIHHAKGGVASIKLSTRPFRVRYVRLRLDESSGTGPRDSHDIRDRLGFAIREVYVGTINSRGRFYDQIRHGPTHETQTNIYVSSTDPWHREIDRDDNIEQPGFDFVFASGLTNGLPIMLPVPVLYDTPDNASAEIEYVTARGYPIDRVEMGEEPDGQFVDSEHYAQLYLRFVDALRRINFRLHFGGPSMQDIEQTQVPGRIELGKAGWLGRFLQYLKARDRWPDFSFFSFEWYPFENDCEPAGEQLQNAPVLLNDALNELQQGGLSKDIPWIVSEYGYSAFGARAEIDLEGALVNADSVGRFLTMGGDAAYLYGYEPGETIKENECSAGNNMLFFLDDGQTGKPTATYWGARLLTQEWVEPGDEVHELYPASSDLINSQGEQIVTAYALHRPDGPWSVLLINKDPQQAHIVSVVFRKSADDVSNFAAAVDVFQFSREQYQLNSDRDHPWPIKSEPPAHLALKEGRSISLPPYSLTIARGQTPP